MLTTAVQYLHEMTTCNYSKKESADCLFPVLPVLVQDSSGAWYSIWDRWIGNFKLLFGANVGVAVFVYVHCVDT